MGLSIYLDFYGDFAAAMAAEAAYQEEVTALWDRIAGRHGGFSKSQRDRYWAARKALGERLGIDERGFAKDRKRIEIDSAKYPVHFCKIGYLRSPYNEFGFNRISRELLGENGFYWLFDPERTDGYHFQPNWTAVKARAEHLLQKYYTVLAKDGGRLRATFKTFEDSAAVCERRTLRERALSIVRGDDWYWQAIEIVIENCDYALGHPEREKLYLIWYT